MTQDEQQVLFFGTPINVFALAKMRLARLIVGGDHAYLLAAWYTQFRDLAKQGKRFGTFSANTVTIVDAIGAPRPADGAPELVEFVLDHVRFWTAMVEADLIEVEGDVARFDRLVRVTVVDYEETNVARKSRVTASRRDVTMTAAERQAVRREQSRRDADGEPRMDDDERDSWILERRASRRHVTSRHVTPKGEDRKDSYASPSASRAVTSQVLAAMADPAATPESLEARFGPLRDDHGHTWATWLAEVRVEQAHRFDIPGPTAEQIAELEAVGSARSQPVEFPESVEGERSDDSGRDLAPPAAPRAHPRRRPQSRVADSVGTELGGAA